MPKPDLMREALSPRPHTPPELDLCLNHGFTTRDQNHADLSFNRFKQALKHIEEVHELELQMLRCQLQQPTRASKPHLHKAPEPYTLEPWAPRTHPASNLALQEKLLVKPAAPFDAPKRVASGSSPASVQRQAMPHRYGIPSRAVSFDLPAKELSQVSFLSQHSHQSEHSHQSQHSQLSQAIPARIAPHVRRSRTGSMSNVSCKSGRSIKSGHTHVMDGRSFSSVQTEDEAYITTFFCSRAMSEFSIDSKDILNRNLNKYLPFVDAGMMIIIIFNAVEMALSQDIQTDWSGWGTLELCWLICYSIEFLIKWKLFGLMRYFDCKSRHKYWNWLDGTCLALGYIELFVTRFGPDHEEKELLRLLRLSRIARMLRILRYRIFRPLRTMVLGVIAGVRVLGWAIILLLAFIFVFGVALRMILGDEVPEFENVTTAMLSIFRCYTDGCTAFDGTPLHAHLYEEYGVIFLLSYTLSFMFVTVGLFNLIIATLVEKVHLSSEARRLADLDVNRHKALKQTNETFGYLIASDPDISQDSEGEVIIPRTSFNEWLKTERMSRLLDEIDVQVSCQGELFDVLDTDSGGDLTYGEVVVGLMRMRGPITKADIVAMRLRIRHTLSMLQHLMANLGIDDHRSNVLNEVHHSEGKNSPISGNIGILTPGPISHEQLSEKNDGIVTVSSLKRQSIMGKIESAFDDTESQE